MSSRSKIIILLILSAAFLIVGFILQPKKSNPQTETPIPQASLPPPANTTPMDSKNISFRFSADPVLPTVLPGYSYSVISRQRFTELVKNIAPSTGFTASYSGILQNGTLSISWVIKNEAELTGTHTDKSATILYRRVKAPDKPDPTLPQEQVVSKLLSILSPAGTTYKITPEPASGDPLTGLLILDRPAPATFKEFAYSYTLNGYAITDDSYSITSGSVVIDNWNVIRFASVTIPPNVVAQTAGISLINKEGILSSIQSGRAGILHTYSANSPEWGVAPVFTSFEITSVRVVYAPKDGYLMPGYLISGTGTNTSGVAQKSRMFMWAFAGN